MDRANSAPGEDVPGAVGIRAASGTAAVQIANFSTAGVIATAGGDAPNWPRRANLAPTTSSITISEDIAAQVKKFTGKRGVDVVFEHVGRDLATPPRRLWPRPGCLVTRGNTTWLGRQTRPAFSSARTGRLPARFMGTMGELHEVLRFVFRQAIATGDRSRISAGVRIRAAHERLENKEQFGKIALLPQELNRIQQRNSATLFHEWWTSRSHFSSTSITRAGAGC